jgi:hypothetical protein
MEKLSKLGKALYETVKDPGVLKWELGSTALYATPATIRFITKNPVIPVLNFPGSSPSPYLPPNLVEKLVVNSFFPGGAGGVAGEIFFSKYMNKPLHGKAKYLSRLTGSLTQYVGWTSIQYLGYLQNIIGPHGENIFEPPEITLGFNLLMAAASIFTPDVLKYIKSKLVKYLNWRNERNIAVK